MCIILFFSNSGYEVTHYELLQMPHSSEGSQHSSAVTSRPDSSNPSLNPPPPQPLQLGRLTNELYKLHSSSTHSLLASTYSRDRKGSYPSAKSLQDLDKLMDEDTSLNAFTQPSISLTSRGKGMFQELFFPPPIIPLPKIKTKNKKPVSQSDSHCTSPNDRKTTERGSRTPSPNLQRSQSHTPSSQSQSQTDSKQLLADVPSHSSLSPLAQMSHVTTSSRAVEECSSKKAAAVVSQSKMAQKLLQKRAKFCQPGTCTIATYLFC